MAILPDGQHVRPLCSTRARSEEYEAVKGRLLEAAGLTTMDAGQQLFQLDSQDTRGKTAIASSWQQASPELYTQDEQIAVRPQRPISENMVRGKVGSTELDFVLDTGPVCLWFPVVV